MREKIVEVITWWLGQLLRVDHEHHWKRKTFLHKLQMVEINFQAKEK